MLFAVWLWEGGIAWPVTPSSEQEFRGLRTQDCMGHVLAGAEVSEVRWVLGNWFSKYKWNALALSNGKPDLWSLEPIEVDFFPRPEFWRWVVVGVDFVAWPCHQNPTVLSGLALDLSLVFPWSQADHSISRHYVFVPEMEKGWGKGPFSMELCPFL